MSFKSFEFYLRRRLQNCLNINKLKNTKPVNHSHIRHRKVNFKTYVKSINLTICSGVMSTKTFQTGFPSILPLRSHKLLTIAATAIAMTPFSGPSHLICPSLLTVYSHWPMLSNMSCNRFRNSPIIDQVGVSQTLIHYIKLFAEHQEPETVHTVANYLVTPAQGEGETMADMSS